MTRICNPQAMFLGVLAAALLTPHRSFSQTNFSGPSGSYTNSGSLFSGSPVWFVGGFSTWGGYIHRIVNTNKVITVTNTVVLTNTVPNTTNTVVRKEKIVSGYTNTIASVSFPITVIQTGAGGFRGSGDTTNIEVSYLEPGQTNFTTLPSFPGTYRVGGSIITGGGLGLGVLTTSANGMTTISGINQRVVGSDFYTFTIVRGGVLGWHVTSLRARSLGSKIERSHFGPISTSAFFGQYGSWTLVMSLSTTNNRVTSPAPAVVTVNGSQTYTFNVKGIFKPKTQQSTLILTPAGTISRGSTLQVGMSTNTVTTIRGRISGQQVRASF